MKITINKKQIEGILVKSISFIEPKDMSQITSNVLITLSDGVMTINATDYEIGLKSTVNTMGIIKDGSAIVNGKKLLDIIKILKNDDVTMEKKGDNLHMSQSRSKFKLSLFNDGEFPRFPDVDKSKEILIDSSVMINAFRLITPSIDVNNPKYEFNGALLNIKKDGIDFVSTDTRRLSISNIQNNNDNELSIIIPRKAILEIQKLFFEDIKIYCNDNYLIIESDNFVFFTKLISGKYPDIQRVIPSSTNNELKISKMLMIESIKQIKTVSNEVKINFNGNKITFTSTGDANNEAVTDIEIDSVCDVDITMAVNSKYILDFLGVIYDNEFTIGINEENMPIVLSSDDLKTIIMPIVL